MLEALRVYAFLFYLQGLVNDQELQWGGISCAAIRNRIDSRKRSATRFDSDASFWVGPPGRSGAPDDCCFIQRRTSRAL